MRKCDTVEGKLFPGLLSQHTDHQLRKIIDRLTTVINKMPPNTVKGSDSIPLISVHPERSLRRSADPENSDSD